MLTRFLAAAAAAVGIAQAAQAAYPEKPVRIVVAYAPGGAVDVVARRLAQKLTEQTGQTFLVENKPGATGLIGTQQVVRSRPTGTHCSRSTTRTRSCRTRSRSSPGITRRISSRSR